MGTFCVLIIKDTTGCGGRLGKAGCKRTFGHVDKQEDHHVDGPAGKQRSRWTDGRTYRRVVRKGQRVDERTSKETSTKACRRIGRQKKGRTCQDVGR